MTRLARMGWLVVQAVCLATFGKLDDPTKGKLEDRIDALDIKLIALRELPR